MKKISVIVPVYNVEKYLKKCLDSIISQKYVSFELLIIDDGSTDNSSKIYEAYKSDERIKIFKLNNGGVSKARNFGLDKASGEYITFVDSDDWLNDDYLLKMVNYIEEKKCDIVFSNSIDVINSQEILNITINNDETSIGLERLYIDYFSKKRHAYSVWGKLFKKSILKNIKFKNLKYGEDTLFVFESINNDTKIGYLNYAGYYYLNRSTGAMNTLKNYEKSKDNLLCSKIMYDKSITLKNNIIINKCKKKIIDDLFWFFKESINNDYDDKDIEIIRERILYTKRLSIKKIIMQLYCMNNDFIKKIIKKIM